MPATDPAGNVWNDTLLQNPHEVSDKRTRVQKMFAAIAPSYDLNNRLHSLWMDQRWRRKAVDKARLQWTDCVVDVACGTGDLTIEFVRKLHSWLPHPFESEQATQNRIIGIDFTFEMLPLARQKAQQLGPLFRPAFINGDALQLPFANESADVITIAFGIRNVSDVSAAIREFFRVLRPDGRLIILEFSLPTSRLLRALYNFYFTKVLPRTATWISRDKTGAYKYLPQSVNTFISRESMQKMMSDAGFTDVQAFPFTFGICVCYRGIKP